MSRFDVFHNVEVSVGWFSSFLVSFSSNVYHLSLFVGRLVSPVNFHFINPISTWLLYFLSVG